MSKYCNCPVGAAISDIPLSDCPEDFGQIQKIIFQRVFSTGATKNQFPVVTGATGPTLLASWTPLLAAADGTKVVQSPYIQSPSNEVGAKREFGGGNATLGGIPLVIGREASTFTAMILQAPQDTIKALKEYSCEKVGVYLVDEFGRIGGLSPADNFLPIPIMSLFIGDKKFGNLEEADSNSIEFKLNPNWSDDFKIVVPEDFDALTELVTPA